MTAAPSLEPSTAHLAPRRRLSRMAAEALDGRPLPPRPPRRHEPTVRELDWQDHAACRAVGIEGADLMTEATFQRAASYVAARFCRRCPVAYACLTFGRATHGYGLWGGLVLRGGQVAPVDLAGTETGSRAAGIAAWLAANGRRLAGTPNELQHALRVVVGTADGASLVRVLGRAAVALEDAGVTTTRDQTGRWTLALADPEGAP